MTSTQESSARLQNLKGAIGRLARGMPNEILNEDLQARMQTLINAGYSSFALSIPLHAKVIHFAEELPEQRFLRHVDAIFSHLFHWMEQFLRMPAGPYRAQKAHELVDLAIARSDQNAPEAMKKSCHKGCSYCCHTRVAATSSEANLIHDFLESEPAVQVDHKRVHLQKDIKDPEVYARILAWKDSACTFLNEKGECKIYPVRPTSCRKHEVVTDPKLCDPHEANKPGYLVHLEAEIIASALYNIELGGKDEIPSLPELLWANIATHQPMISGASSQTEQ